MKTKDIDLGAKKLADKMYPIKKNILSDKFAKIVFLIDVVLFFLMMALIAILFFVILNR